MQLAPAHKIPKETLLPHSHSPIQMAPGLQGDQTHCCPFPEKTQSWKVSLSIPTCSEILLPDQIHSGPRRQFFQAGSNNIVGVEQGLGKGLDGGNVGRNSGKVAEVRR